LGIDLPDNEEGTEGTEVGVAGLKGAGNQIFINACTCSHYIYIILPLEMEIVGNLDGAEVEVGLLVGARDRHTHTYPHMYIHK